jgi:SOS response regulatory protein OraA/RecX
VPRITALRAAGRRSVAIELDGERWRTLPLEAVVRAGLTVGSDLERQQVWVLARERRRLAALDAAVAAVRRRDRSAQDVTARLEQRGVPAGARVEALGALRRAGLVDDGRYAVGRADALARKGYGDAWIRHDLQRSGVAADQIAAALEALPPESERAAEEARRLGGGLRAARGLARRGFGDELVEALVAAAADAELG